jgi:hypothetical protein
VYECYLPILHRHAGFTAGVDTGCACRLKVGQSWHKVSATGMELIAGDSMDVALSSLLVNWMHAEGHKLNVCW